MIDSSPLQTMQVVKDEDQLLLSISDSKLSHSCKVARAEGVTGAISMYMLAALPALRLF